VDLPEPLGPTIAVLSPALTAKEAFEKISLVFSIWVGYLKLTLSNKIYSLSVIELILSC